jgi:chromosome segregation ATPase
LIHNAGGALRERIRALEQCLSGTEGHYVSEVDRLNRRLCESHESYKKLYAEMLKLRDGSAKDPQMERLTKELAKREEFIRTLQDGKPLNTEIRRLQESLSTVEVDRDRAIEARNTYIELNWKISEVVEGYRRSIGELEAEKRDQQDRIVALTARVQKLEQRNKGLQRAVATGIVSPEERELLRAGAAG